MTDSIIKTGITAGISILTLGFLAKTLKEIQPKDEVKDLKTKEHSIIDKRRFRL